MDFAQAFQEGGVLMFPIAGGGAVSWGTGFLAPLTRSRSLGLIALVAAAVTLGIGLLGWMEGHRELEEALAVVSPEFAEQARAIGTRIAGIPLRFALLGAVPGFLGGIVGVILGRPRAEPGAG